VLGMSTMILPITSKAMMKNAMSQCRTMAMPL
jgi:hypothetical protein